MDNKIIELINKYPNDAELGNAIRRAYWRESTIGAKIFESPDKGKTIYSRQSGETEKTLVTKQMEIPYEG
jgi:hypothetical protein